MKTKSSSVLRFRDLEVARRRIASGIRVTPCLRHAALSHRIGMEIWLKRDDLQRTGSFKERGARNALLSLAPAQRARGVVAASAGNHALGLAFHGAQLGVPVTVVVPSTAPEVKRARCRALGARVVVHGATFEQAQDFAVELAREADVCTVHPFDDLRVVAGQGTVGLEMLEQCSGADAVVVPVGGGGLLAGIATAIKTVRPSTRVIAVEPAHAAGFLAAELCGRPTSAMVLPTLADGLAVSRVGETTFAIAAPLVDDVVTVTEEEIAVAIATLATVVGAVVEGAGATALAAVLAGKVQARSVVVPVCGRNIDARRHARIVAEHSSAVASVNLERAA